MMLVVDLFAENESWLAHIHFQFELSELLHPSWRFARTKFVATTLKCSPLQVEEVAFSEWMSMISIRDEEHKTPRS